MPRGLQGQKRPGDVVGAAVIVAKIATGEIADHLAPRNESIAAELGRRGGVARAISLSKKKRQQIA